MTGVTGDRWSELARRSERNPAVRSVSCVIGCQNLATRIGAAIQRMHCALTGCNVPFEIIVVDDCSTDASGEVLTRLQETIPQLRVVRHGRRLGYGAALRAGFRAASYEWVYCTDGTANYDVEEVITLVGWAADNVDWVKGRKTGDEGSWSKRLIGSASNRGVELLLGVGITDIVCTSRLIRRSLLDRLDLGSTSGAVCAEMVYRGKLAGARVVEVPVRRPHHSGGSVRSSHIARMSPEILRLRLRLMVFDRFHT